MLPSHQSLPKTWPLHWKTHQNLEDAPLQCELIAAAAAVTLFTVSSAAWWLTKACFLNLGSKQVASASFSMSSTLSNRLVIADIRVSTSFFYWCRAGGIPLIPGNNPLKTSSHQYDFGGSHKPTKMNNFFTFCTYNKAKINITHTRNT